MDEIIFSFADSNDLGAIEQLLMECELPYGDVEKHLSHFIVARKEAKLIGIIGLEVLNPMGLVRSLAVSSGQRGKGIAKELYAKIQAYAHLKGIKTLYLLTLTAEGFFAKSGFKKIARDRTPPEIQATEEFHSLCPVTAVCMVKDIDRCC